MSTGAFCCGLNSRSSSACLSGLRMDGEAAFQCQLIANETANAIGQQLRGHGVLGHLQVELTFAKGEGRFFQRHLLATDRKSTRLNSSHQCAPRMPTPACKT